MTLVEFTHANHKVPMAIVRELVGGFYHSPAQQCTYIVSNGGAIFPTSESVAEVKRKLGFDAMTIGETNERTSTGGNGSPSEKRPDDSNQVGESVSK